MFNSSSWMFHPWTWLNTLWIKVILLSQELLTVKSPIAPFFVCVWRYSVLLLLSRDHKREKKPNYYSDKMTWNILHPVMSDQLKSKFFIRWFLLVLRWLDPLGDPFLTWFKPENSWLQALPEDSSDFTEKVIFIGQPEQL